LLILFLSKQNSPDLASLILCSLLVLTHCVVLR
jgi:hypothetical protein